MQLSECGVSQCFWRHLNEGLINKNEMAREKPFPRTDMAFFFFIDTELKDDTKVSYCG